MIDVASLDPVALAVALSLLDPVHPVAIAARAGLDVAAMRSGWPQDYIGGRYHRPTRLPERTALQVARWPPTGDRELWIRYGPAGPPAVVAVAA